MVVVKGHITNGHFSTDLDILGGLIDTPVPGGNVALVTVAHGRGLPVATLV